MATEITKDQERKGKAATTGRNINFSGYSQYKLIKTDGERLRFVRENKNLTQQQLANLCGIPQQEISKLERAEEIDDERIALLSKALDVDPKLLTDWETMGFTSNYNNNEMGRGEGNTVMAGGNNFETKHTVIIHPLDEIIKIYDRIIIDKDVIIDELKKEVKEYKEKYEYLLMNRN